MEFFSLRLFKLTQKVIIMFKAQFFLAVMAKSLSEIILHIFSEDFYCGKVVIIKCSQSTALSTMKSEFITNAPHNATLHA